MTLDERYPLLSEIDLPADLRKLPIEHLPKVCQEIRQYILEVLSEHPGHLGASLGAVDFTVALHYVFDTPVDRLVWDVGHQAYAHKILTGRREAFRGLRQWGGIAGFPSTDESEYDTFTGGHASNAISAALGMAVASSAKEDDRQVVAIIGDGAMTGGLAFEGLNNASSYPNNLLIVLNDNNMSIDRNVGGLNRYMVDILTSKTYNTIRYDLYQCMRRMRLINDKNRQRLLRLNNSIKALISNQTNLFEGFSIRYFGPVDGNDVIRTVAILNDIKRMKGPKILHLKTIKGKGYAPAESNAIVWHAPGKFDVSSGQRIGESAKIRPQLYQDVFGKTLVEFAERDKRVVGITPAMPSGCSMTFLMDRFPDRAYDVGIAEGHAVTFSAGLAREGFIPFCNIYSSFMQRAYDQVIHDACISREHVIFCLDRAGLVGEDGATHHGAFDLAYLYAVPNLIVSSPYNEHELRNLMYTAYAANKGPFAIRYPRGRGELIEWQNEPKALTIGQGRQLRTGSKLAFLSLGPIGNDVARVAERLSAEGLVDAAHYDMVFLKPMDTDILNDVAHKYEYVITIEDGTLAGGFGATIATYMLEHGHSVRLKRLGLPDEFISQGTQDRQRQYCGLDQESIYQSTKSFLGL